MKDTVKAYAEQIIKKPLFWIPWITLSVLAYIPSLVLPVFHFEDLQREYYFGKNGVMWAGRWGMSVWVNIFSSGEANGLFEKTLAWFFLMAASVVIGCILFYYDDEPSALKYTLFSTSMVIFPLSLEIWNYNGANFISYGTLLIAAICVLLLAVSDASMIHKLLAVICGLTFVEASYETGAFSYIFIVVMMLTYRNRKCKEIHIPKEAILYGGPFVVAFFLQLGIGNIICKVMNISYSRHGETAIFWFQPDFSICDFLKKFIEAYFLRGLIYLPIFVFCMGCCFIMLDVTIKVIKKRSIKSIFWSVFLFLSLFVQAIIQGKSMSYRTAQAISIYVAFGVFVLLEDVVEHRVIYWIAVLGMTFLCIRQSCYLNTMQVLAYKMSDFESEIIQYTGERLYSEYYGKPVEIIVNPRISIEGLNKELANQNRTDRLKWNTIIYNVLYGKLFKEYVVSRRVTESFYYSPIFMYRDRPDLLSKWFEQSGYPINLYCGEQDEWDELQLHDFEIRDMNEYVVVAF